MKFVNKFNFLALFLALLLSLVACPALASSPADDNGSNDDSISFVDSGQRLADAETDKVGLADLDGDGDIDAFCANSGPNKIWFNDGKGTFTSDNQTYGDDYSGDVALADLDGDGDIDAIVANSGPSRVWLNNGDGTFADDGQMFTSETDDFTNALAVGDLDGDGDIDIFFGYEYDGGKVWLNDGAGTFVDSGQSLGALTSSQVSMGDVDSDGDMDVVVISCGMYDEANLLWLNDGSGNFTASEQELGVDCSDALGMADLNGDQHLDIVIGGAGSQGEFTVWANNGTGIYSQHQSVVDDINHHDLSFNDLDNDGDIDIVFNSGEIWLNDGTGQFSQQFSQEDQSLSDSLAIAMADLDNDEHLDIFLGRAGPNEVWLNSPLSSTALPISDEPNISHPIFLPFISR